MFNEKLKHFGSLLLDPETVLAVGPIYDNDGPIYVEKNLRANGYRIVTTGGLIDVLDLATIALINQWYAAPTPT
jgi:hypothetical protein